MCTGGYVSDTWFILQWFYIELCVDMLLLAAVFDFLCDMLILGFYFTSPLVFYSLFYYTTLNFDL